MPINESIEDLPSAPRPEGKPPSRNNFVAEAVAQKWYDLYQESGKVDLDLAIPDAGPYRASWANKRCDRDLYYALAGLPDSNELTIADHWRFGIGHIVHEALQDVVQQLFPDAQPELNIDLRKIGVPGSSHADLKFEYEGKATLVEIKSVGGFRFKAATTAFKGPPEGPSYGYIIQAGLSAWAEDCPQIVICYLSLENLSPQLADFSDTEAGRFAAEWHFSLEQLKPILEAEVERIQRVLADVEAGTPSPRALHDPYEVPEGAVVVDPNGPRNRGRWQVRLGETLSDHGETWICGYCNQRDRCTQDGAT